MKDHLNLGHALRTAVCVALSVNIVMPMPAFAATTVDLAKAPLANATTTTVLPNLMFVLDTSGSMGWNYLPDYVNDGLCLDTNGGYSLGCTDQPLFQSPDFNGVYYNPAIRYLPAVDASGNDWPSQTSWTAVKNDAFDTSSSPATTNLVTGYVDVEWCTSTSYTDCLRSDNYILPGTVNSKVYKYQHATTSTGSGSVATGSPSAPTTAARTWGPHYYTIVPGEYCDSAKLTNCQVISGGNFTFPAKVRWCTTAANATAETPAAGTCQGIRTGSFTTPRFPTKFFTTSSGTPAGPTTPASVTFTLSTNGCGGSTKVAIASMKVNNVTNILASATVPEKNASSLVSDVNGQGTNGYTISGTSSSITITAPVSAGNITSTITIAAAAGGGCTFSPTTTPALSGYKAATPAVNWIPNKYYGSFVRTDIVSGGTYPKAVTRTDCADSSSCTGTEEMTNFANWWTYYQTRIQTMKTSVSRAFKPINDKYRVGFIDIWGNYYLPIDTFKAGTGSVKEKWYTQLFGVSVGNGTPLRSALTRVGRLYAGFDFSGNRLAASDDPVQYSCQQNFTLMTTDGYWNTDADTAAVGVKGAQIGDMDGGTTPRPKYEGPTAASNTLADIAKYYYDTDLRNKTLWDNCSGNKSGVDVCDDTDPLKPNVVKPIQRMTTFTLGLGVNGALTYTPDYKTALTGDFHDLSTGSNNVNWPKPVADSETAVDDLWHAAVNGGGTYFSAKDPTQLVNGLNTALAQIDAVKGAGAAAATSTLNPVSGDNDVFLASYTTVKWTGNLERRTIDPATGIVGTTASWCVENTDAGCVGTMASQVGTSSDSRKIWMSDGSGALTPFLYSNLTSTQKTYFTGTNLSQWTALSATQQAKAQGDNLVNYLRGQTQYDDRVANLDTGNNIDNRLFRLRDATLGDITESQPAFVGKPQFSYTDAGYSQFVANNSSRAKTVYVGANDGMLHAFDATNNGIERWAFVPKMVIPNLSTLADKNYATKHTNYVNGAPIIADIYAGGAWHTILVAGLNGGGRGFYAIEITDPSNPKLLWEIDSNTDSDIGYSFGQPVITKNKDGAWVVLLTSGYNNTSPGTGEGVLFVRDAYTGAAPATGLSRISNKEGTIASPSGLARIGTWSDAAEKNNTAGFTYGGDLNGNLWRFDINAASQTAAVLKFAVLKDSSGNPQPITTEPVLGSINDTRVVFVGTGKYLEVSDLGNTDKQSIYAIKDDNATTTLNNPRTVLVQQTITTSGDTRSVTTSNSVDFKTGLGWFIDLPDAGERVNVNPILDAGTLFAPTTVPSSTVCTPGGYGWLNYFDYRYGSNGSKNVVSQKFTAPIVGINIVYKTDGKRSVSVVTADDPTPKQPKDPIPDGANASSYRSTRVIWRELIPGH